MYIKYDKQELIDKINKLSIFMNDAGQVITKYGDSVISISNVSNRYEIFDIQKYLIDEIEHIEKNFEISKYQLSVKKGVQSLILLSDVVDIEGVNFHKSFFILNSSDRSRRLSFNAGLYNADKNLYIIPSVKNIELSKKHLKGVTKAAEIASIGLNDETFNEQIELLKNLVGHKVSISKLKEIIVGDGKVKVNHLKFDAFKNQLLYYNSDSRLRLTNEQKTILRIPSEKFNIEQKDDFYVDAFWAFQTYLKIFNRQDSHVIKNETNRILNITVWAIRNHLLELIGI